MSVPAKTLAPERQCCGDSRRGFSFLWCEVCGVVGKAIGAIVWNAAVVREGGGQFAGLLIWGPQSSQVVFMCSVFVWCMGSLRCCSSLL